MKRVLIFGSYANGNLGDAEQAASVARHLRSYSSLLDVVSASHCVADRLYYPENNVTISRNLLDVLDSDFVNSFDAILIGGGGLLAAKHKPLERSSWVEKIKIPIALYGVGANEEVSELCSTLIAKAKIVSVRDEFSLHSIKKFRSDAFILRDPILMDRSLDKSFIEKASPGRLCVIPRKLVSKSEKTYADVASIMLPRDFSVSLFPTTDDVSGALGIFKSNSIFPTVEIESFKTAIGKASIVLSDRYHGCILSMKRGIPVLPLFRSKIEQSSKIFSLYKDLGIAELLYETAHCQTRREIFELAKAVYDPSNVAALFSEWYEEFEKTSNMIFTELDL